MDLSVDNPIFGLEERVARRYERNQLLALDEEDGREAQLVQFFGGCHALLTEWAKLPLLNELIENNKGKIKGRNVSRLSPGDFVLFRAGGDKEFLRLIAEDIIGEQKYQRIRDIAERWKEPLHRLGKGPAEIQRKLKDHGLERTPPTVAGWIRDPERIGPGKREDIETIAMITGDKELHSIKEEVGKAITRVRNAHQKAGMQLTRLILGELHDRLNELGDQPTLLDFDYGQAWVVQVESVERNQRKYAANQVNRLLWHADFAF